MNVLAELIEERKTAFKWIEDNEKRISDFHQEIWYYAEPALREYRSAQAFSRFHREDGFKVEEGIAGMPTSYLAHVGPVSPSKRLPLFHGSLPGNQICLLLLLRQQLFRNSRATHPIPVIQNIVNGMLTEVLIPSCIES